ncbi:virginiamycin B lyase family protein, partial [Streptomyces decoyicus]|uniref:virginiamycin B lyase family protein n=1 Tax=Streptomyces decoyicus TaxID=249567 RepID=UPI0034981FA6
MPVFIEEFTLVGSNSGPYALTTGPDGALWFTLVHSGGIGRLVPGGVLTHHQLDPDCGPTIIAVGPSGRRTEAVEPGGRRGGE